MLPGPALGTWPCEGHVQLGDGKIRDTEAGEKVPGKGQGQEPIPDFVSRQPECVA